MTSTYLQVDAKLERIQDEISQHDILALRALRIWYHLRYAPDEEGNVLNMRERLAAAEEDEDGDTDDNEEKQDGMATESDDDADDDDADAKRTRIEQRYQRKMERNCWSADAVSAFLRGHTTNL